MTTQERAALVALVAKWRKAAHKSTRDVAAAIRNRADDLEAALSALPSGWAACGCHAKFICREHMMAVGKTEPSGGAEGEPDADDVCAICGGEDVRILKLRRCQTCAKAAVSARPTPQPSAARDLRAGRHKT
jgi:hypothetical protein